MPFATTNPATGKTEKEFPTMSPAEVDALLDRAVVAFETYRRTTYAERARHLLTAAELLEGEVPDVARILTTEMGKTFAAAKAEVSKCAVALRWFAENGERLLGDEVIESKASMSYVHYQPLGPVLAVMPWNFPMWQVIRFAAPALMVGNVGLLKHASNVPQTALAIEDLFRRAGLPDGVFTNLFVESKDVAAVIEDPRVAAVTLTGSERAGISVGSAAGRALKKSVLELGGSDPFVVLASADMEACVRTAITARVQNNGQSCIAAKRFIVVDEVFDEFLERFVAGDGRARGGRPVRAGDGHRADRDGGAARRTGQPGRGGGGAGGDGARRRVGPDGGRLVVRADRPVGGDDGHAGGAGGDLRAGGARDAGAGPGPGDPGGELDDVRAGVERVDRRPGRGARRCVEEIEAGAVFVNAMVASTAELPFGGIKRSGYGRELSELGLKEFTNPKTVWIA